MYQGAVLHGYTTTVLRCCADQALADLKKLNTQMRSRLEWSDTTMLRSILVFLDTQSWVCADDNEIKAAVEFIISHFGEPLEAAHINLASIQDELEEIVDYICKVLPWYCRGVLLKNLVQATYSSRS